MSLRVVLLLVTAAGFGASPLLIQVGVQHFPPLWLAALRAGLGVPLLLAVLAVAGLSRRLTAADLVTALVGGVLVIAVPFVTMAAGMQFIPSGLGGILYATMPLFTLVLAALFLRDEPATPERIARIGVGLGGVALIAGPQFLADGLAGAGLGTVLTLLSPLSYAAGNVWFRRRPPVPALALTAGLFAVGAVALWPLALLAHGPGPLMVPDVAVWITLAALVALATVLPALTNYMLVQRAGANGAALVMFLMPGFAVAFGAAFAAERLPLAAFAGLALVLLAVAPLPHRRR